MRGTIHLSHSLGKNLTLKISPIKNLYLFIYLFIYLSIYLKLTMIKKILYTKIHIK